jgi:hypothetical protein
VRELRPQQVRRICSVWAATTGRTAGCRRRGLQGGWRAAISSVTPRTARC